MVCRLGRGRPEAVRCKMIRRTRVVRLDAYHIWVAHEGILTYVAPPLPPPVAAHHVNPTRESSSCGLSTTHGALNSFFPRTTPTERFLCTSGLLFLCLVSGYAHTRVSGYAKRYCIRIGTKTDTNIILCFNFKNSYCITVLSIRIPGSVRRFPS